MLIDYLYYDAKSPYLKMHFYFCSSVQEDVNLGKEHLNQAVRVSV